MDKVISKMTILFEDPFWIGIYEKTSQDQLQVSKILFGTEPKDYEVYSFLMDHFVDLKFSPAIEADIRLVKKVNPKRMHRQARAQTEHTGIGTKSQQALKLLMEEGKLAKKVKNRKQKEEEKQRKFDLHLQKKKEKHRGH